MTQLRHRHWGVTMPKPAAGTLAALWPLVALWATVTDAFVMKDTRVMDTTVGRRPVIMMQEEEEEREL